MRRKIVLFKRMGGLEVPGRFPASHPASDLHKMTSNREGPMKETELVGELSSLRNFFAYNTFEDKYLKYIGRLPKIALEKDRGASHHSILDICTHILDVYRS